MAQGIDAITGEPGGALEWRKSRLTGEDILVRVSLWDQGYEPRPLVVIYAQSVFARHGWAGFAKEKLLINIINKHLHYGDPILPVEMTGSYKR